MNTTPSITAPKYQLLIVEIGHAFSLHEAFEELRNIRL